MVRRSSCFVRIQLQSMERSIKRGYYSKLNINEFRDKPARQLVAKLVLNGIYSIFALSAIPTGTAAVQLPFTTIPSLFF